MYTLCVVVLLFGFVTCDLSIEKTKECGQITCDYLHYCSIIENSCRPCRRVCDVGNNQDIVLCNTHCQDYIHDSRYLRKEEIIENGKGLTLKDHLLRRRSTSWILFGPGDCFVKCDARYPGASDNFHLSGSFYLYFGEKIDKIQVLSTISLIFSLLVFICLVLVVMMFWCRKKTTLNSFSINNKIFTKKEKTDIKRKDDRMHMNTSEISTIKLQGDTVLNMQDITDIIHKTAPPQDDYMNMTTFKNHHAKSEPDSASPVCTNKTNKTSQPLVKRLPSEDSTLDFIYDNPALAPSPLLDKEKGTSGDKKEVNDGGT